MAEVIPAEAVAAAWDRGNRAAVGRPNPYRNTGMSDPLSNAQEAHRAALAAQEAMREASRERDRAVQAARSAGVPAAELATALGVNRHRIHAMLKAAESTTDKGTL